jgi:hypothetical protein
LTSFLFSKIGRWMNPQLNRWRAATLAVVYALSVLLFGFAHKPVQAETADLAAYSIPGAVGPVICHGAGTGTDGDTGIKTHKTCQACLIIAGGFLPAPVPGLFTPTATPIQVLFASRFAACATPSPLYEQRSRAPPVKT